MSFDATGRSGLYSPFPSFVNGHEHLQRMSIASSESSYNDLQNMDADSNNEVLSSALDAHLTTEGICMCFDCGFFIQLVNGNVMDRRFSK